MGVGMGENVRLNLGCGGQVLEGYIGVDIRPGVGQVTADLSKPWPFEDESVDEIRASHLVEHLPDALFTMSEAWRVLKRGGRFDIDVPSTNGMGAFQDPTHRSFWNVNSFLYYDRKNPLGEMYGCNRWEIVVAQEYNTKEMASMGPFIKAILRKPE